MAVSRARGMGLRQRLLAAIQERDESEEQELRQDREEREEQDQREEVQEAVRDDPVEDLLSLEGVSHQDQHQQVEAQTEPESEAERAGEAVYDVRQEVVLQWRRSRRSRFTVGSHRAVTMPQTPFLARAHDSDVLIQDPIVLFPTAERTHGVRLYMAYDKLERDIDLVSVMPWTVHNLFGIRVFQKTVKLPEDRDLPERYPNLLRAETKALQEARLDPNGWVHLRNMLGVYTEQQGVPLVQVYGVAVAKEDYDLAHKTVQVRDRILKLQEQSATNAVLSGRQELYQLLEEYNRTVLETQTVFLLTPLFLARVPEATLRARSFLVAEPVAQDDTQGFLKQEAFFCLPAQVTVVTHYEGLPVLHDGFLLGPTVPAQEVKRVLPLKGDIERDTLGSGPVAVVTAHDAITEVERRRLFGDWARRMTYVVVEAGTRQWREDVERLIQTQLLQHIVFVAVESFTNQTQPTTQMVYSALFIIKDQFFVSRSSMTGSYVVGTNALGKDSVCLLCNSCTLVVDPERVLTPRDVSVTHGADRFAGEVVCVVAQSVWEAIVYGWNRDDAKILHLSVSQSRRYATQGSRIYYGPGLGRLVVVDREGKTMSKSGLLPEEHRAMQLELERQGILETPALCILDTHGTTIVIADLYRVVIETETEKGNALKATVTRDMILVQGVYIVSLVMGMLGTLQQKQALSTYKGQSRDREKRALSSAIEYRALRDAKARAQEYIPGTRRARRVSEVPVDL